MTILFTVEFVVDTSTRGNYREFIRNLRVRLGVRYSHNLPALAVQENPPTQFFDVVLTTQRSQTQSRSVRFRLRADNLYLLGYRMGSTAGQWLEFGMEGTPADQHLITEPGTSWLGFNCSYSGQHGLKAAAKRSMENIRVGYHNLVSATDDLAVTTDEATRARSLIVVIMMICEATRLNPVLEYMATNFNNSTSGGADEGVIETWVANLATSWYSLSSAVLRADAFPEQSFQLRPNLIQIPPDNRTVTTIQQAVEVLAILLGLCFSPSRPDGRRRLLAAPLNNDNDQGMCYLGSPILQVFSVQINNIDNENPGQLFGTIKINNGLYTEFIYNRTRGNPESIKPGQNATLTGPETSVISAYGQITFIMLLTDKDYLTSDDIIIDDSISWDANDISNVYDKLISHQLSSSRGMVTLNYAVFRNAVSAQLSITLEFGGERTCEVFGSIFVRYNHDEATTCLLFERASDNYVSVNRWEKIPLLKSIIAVPLDAPVELTANLLDYDPITSNDPIAQGTVQLSPPDQIPSSTFTSITGGTANFVRVDIRWTFAL